ncbi:hypothetical protein [Streptomyces sp. 8N616]|uniref:hypothetical protein n=1 Tax=Streptomyces sp. 8N616 TaxID=3457414 RepID=UPI003FCF2902
MIRLPLRGVEEQTGPDGLAERTAGAEAVLLGEGGDELQATAVLIVDTGIALARLGEASRAGPLIAERLRREKTAQQRGRAFHAFWLATTQLQQSKLDRACHSAGLALDLTAAIDSPRVVGHVQEFHRRLAPYARELPVIAFDQRMREVLGRPPASRCS